jgi:hypothetical protein
VQPQKVISGQNPDQGTYWFPDRFESGLAFPETVQQTGPRPLIQKVAIVILAVRGRILMRYEFHQIKENHSWNGRPLSTKRFA